MGLPNFLLKKFQLLFMTLFEKINGTKSSQNMPEWQNGYGEFLDIFFDMERYPEFAKYLQGQNAEQTQLQV